MKINLEILCVGINNKTHTCFVVVKTAELLASAKPGHWGR